MRGIWTALVVGVIAAAGCTSGPKREMRQNPQHEELVGPPNGTYLEPRAADRDQPILQPKNGAPVMNTSGGMPSPSGPSSGPGMTPGASRR
jgi:hypothetical protein